MPKEKFTILSTRPLDESLIQQANLNNVEVHSISFIRTEPLNNDSLEKRISEIVDQQSTVIFTSMNAAEAVAFYLKGSKPQWSIYCLGTATKKIIEQHFPDSRIIGEADNAFMLADEIIKDKVEEVIFFCGDQRRDELPGKLTDSNISLEEIIIYKTIAIEEKIERVYDGILFFSPSAVNSYFSINEIPSQTVLFAIGSTTGRALKEFSDNKIIESDYPGKQNLVEKAIEYFGKLNHTNEHIKK